MASRRRRSKDQAPGWAWMLLGLGIGLGVALVVYLKSGSDTFMPPTTAAKPDTGTQPRAASQPAPAQPKPATADAKSIPDTGIQDDFEFFHILPESEIVLPEPERNLRGETSAPQEYTIQAGSFTTHEDADRLLARLALLNISAKIQPALVDDQIHYRVIIGPLSERGEINRVVRRLRDERIDSLISTR
jgi:cell division protein FtsN